MRNARVRGARVCDACVRALLAICSSFGGERGVCVETHKIHLPTLRQAVLMVTAQHCRKATSRFF